MFRLKISARAHVQPGSRGVSRMKGTTTTRLFQFASYKRACLFLSYVELSAKRSSNCVYFHGKYLTANDLYSRAREWRAAERRLYLILRRVVWIQSSGTQGIDIRVPVCLEPRFVCDVLILVLGRDKKNYRDEIKRWGGGRSFNKGVSSCSCL